MHRFLLKAFLAVALLSPSLAAAQEAEEGKDKLRRILVTEIVNNDVKAPWVPLLADHVAQTLKLDP